MLLQFHDECDSWEAASLLETTLIFMATSWFTVLTWIGVCCMVWHGLSEISNAMDALNNDKYITFGMCCL